MSIEAAVAELNKEIDRITKIRDSLLAGLPNAQPVGTRPTPASVSAKSAKKRVLSAAARKRISEATKKRWAAIRKSKQPAK